MPKTAFCIAENDNVATILESVESGETVIINGSSRLQSVVAAERIEAPHKIVLRRIEGGEPVIKYGQAIGTATDPIDVGYWVHLHNLASNYDKRSASLDLGTGATTDTCYQ